MAVIVTECPFTLPNGYQGADGTPQREGVMRQATAGDVLIALKDHRVQQDPAYVEVILLARVILRLGSLDMITTAVIEALLPADRNYLRALYNRFNDVDGQAPAVRALRGR
jgi:hypothetical protein